MKTREMLFRCVVFTLYAGLACSALTFLPDDADAVGKASTRSVKEAEVSASKGLRENPQGECLLVITRGAALRGKPTNKGKILERLPRGTVLNLSPDEEDSRGDWFDVYQIYEETDGLGGMAYLHYSYPGELPDFYVHKKDVKRVDCPGEQAEEP